MNARDLQTRMIKTSRLPKITSQNSCVRRSSWTEIVRRACKQNATLMTSFMRVTRACARADSAAVTPRALQEKQSVNETNTKQVYRLTSQTSRSALSRILRANKLNNTQYDQATHRIVTARCTRHTRGCAALGCFLRDKKNHQGNKAKTHTSL